MFHSLHPADVAWAFAGGYFWVRNISGRLCCRKVALKVIVGRLVHVEFEIDLRPKSHH